MKHTKKYIALCLAMALGCLAVLTACSSDKSTSQTQSTGTSSSQASSGSTESTEAQETVMGEVTYVGSRYITVTAYTGGEDVTDFTTLDVSGLTASEDTESIDTTEDTEYLKVESGMLNAATRDDVTTGPSSSPPTTRTAPTRSSWSRAATRPAPTLIRPPPAPGPPLPAPLRTRRPKGQTLLPLTIRR